MRKGTILLVISAVIAVIGGIAVYFVVDNVVAKAANENPKKSPVSMVGDWVQSNTEGGVQATATISDVGSIQINLKTRDSSNIYWMGSFDTPKDAAGEFEVVSLADPDAQKVMGSSLFGSQDKSKKFAYRNGELSYEFTMMGTTKKVLLTKK